MVADGASSVVAAVSVGAAVGLAGLATTVGPVLHVVLFDRHARVHEVTVRARRSRWPFDAWPRVAVAAVVLLAAVGGAAAIRVEEMGVHDPGFEEPTVDASSAAVYAVALENTARSNHRAVMTSDDRSGGGRHPTLVWDWRYDYRDRQATIRFYAPAGTAADTTGGGEYYDSGVLGVHVGDEAGPTWNGTWTAAPAPGRAFVADRRSRGSDGGTLPNADAPWTVVSNNASTLVLWVTMPEAIREVLVPESHAGMGENMTDESRLTVWIGRERVVVDRAVWHVHSRDVGRNFSHGVRTSEVGTYDVTRPESLPPRHPLEWVWDAIYY